MIHRRILSTILIVSLVIFLITGCKVAKKEDVNEPLDNDNLEIEEDDESLRETILFYQDDYGYLVPIMRKIKWEEGIAKAALSKLIDNPEEQQAMLSMGLKALLPANTTINGISIEDGLAKVDLSSNAMEHDDAISENNMVQGIVMTLTEFPAIDRVQLFFDGNEVDALAYGTQVKDPMEAEKINLESSSDYLDYGQEMTVFYHNISSSRYEYLIPITRITSNQELTLETVIDELFKGPQGDGNLHLDVPTNTQVLGVEMDDGITFVNLSKEFNSLKDSESEEIVLKAIAMTAKQFPGVAEVNILVEGKDYKGSETLAIPTFVNEY